MTPFSFEWQWNIEYVIFMGFLYLALGIVGCGLIVAYVKSWMDAESGEDHEKEDSSKIGSRTKYSTF